MEKSSVIDLATHSNATNQDTPEGLMGKNANHNERKNYGSRNAKTKHMTSHTHTQIYVCDLEFKS